MMNRWKYVDYPDSIRFKEKREKTHPEIFLFDDLPEDQKAVLRLIKKTIQFFHPKARLFLFGSRINGRWIEESDYDVMIIADLTLCEMRKLQKINFGVKTDFKMSTTLTSLTKVEII